MRKEFNYFMPTKIVFGNGYIDKVEEYIKKYGINKLCLITDSFLAETSFGQKLIESINGVKVFTEVEINPGIQSSLQMKNHYGKILLLLNIFIRR